MMGRRKDENQVVKVKVLFSFFGSGDMWVVRREGGATLKTRSLCKQGRISLPVTFTCQRTTQRRNSQQPGNRSWDLSGLERNQETEASKLVASYQLFGLYASKSGNVESALPL